MKYNSKYVSYSKEGNLILPNIKKIFLPDEGMELLDGDLSGADAMVVAADSECKWLLDFFNSPKGKLYAYIASEHLQREVTSDSPEYKSYKAVCHGSNYGLGLDKLCTMLGISYTSAKSLQDFYFSLCKEIPKWHEKIRSEVNKKGFITNIFGRRGWFIDKKDPTLLNKAYAFIPQATVSDVINRGWVNIKRTLPEVDVLLQVHDSLVVQYPMEKAEFYRRKIKECMEIPLPYDPVLIIPSDFKVSTLSYGDVKKPQKSLS